MTASNYQYAVQLAWPDGTVETGRPTSRTDAEATVRIHDINGRHDGRASVATLVRRPVGEWQPINGWNGAEQ